MIDLIFQLTTGPVRSIHPGGEAAFEQLFRRCNVLYFYRRRLPPVSEAQLATLSVAAPLGFLLIATLLR